MKKIFLLLVLIFSNSGYSAETDLTLRYLSKESYSVVQTKKINGIRVNEICLKTGSTCQALRVLKAKVSSAPKTTAPFVGNPAANFCWDVGAKNRILKDEQNNQYDYCVFEDGSMADAWMLYEAHHPKAVAK